MTSLSEVVAAATMRGATEVVTGRTSRSWDGDLVVQVQGVTVPAVWLDTVHPAAGHSVLVLLTRGPVGQSAAVVLGRLQPAPHPVMGQVRSVSTTTAQVALDDGQIAQAAWVGRTTPAVGDRVRILWQGAEPVILGVSGSTATDSASTGTAAPDQTVQVSGAGTTVLRAAGSGMWTPGGTAWPGALIQGTGYGTTDAHSGWGYGSGIRALAGVTVTGATLHLAGRNRSGAYNAAATFHLSCHGQTDLTSRPETAAAGWDVTLPGAGGGWPLDTPVPVTVAQWLVDHAGGLMISGQPYAGLLGTDSDPTSGQLTITWTR